jgi:solute carrier family 8 (sodium/calcium exchanger)
MVIALQRNQAGNSPAMELMGFQQCMEYLFGYGILITTFISDRHIGIASPMRKVLSNITHYFDIWHLKNGYKKWEFSSIYYYF